jgi:hypothetical protein
MCFGFKLVFCNVILSIMFTPCHSVVGEFILWKKFSISSLKMNTWLETKLKDYCSLYWIFGGDLPALPSLDPSPLLRSPNLFVCFIRSGRCPPWMTWVRDMRDRILELPCPSCQAWWGHHLVWPQRWRRASCSALLPKVLFVFKCIWSALTCWYYARMCSGEHWNCFCRLFSPVEWSHGFQPRHAVKYNFGTWISTKTYCQV